MLRNAPYAQVKARQAPAKAADDDMALFGIHALPVLRHVRQDGAEVLIDGLFQIDAAVRDRKPVFHRAAGHGMEVADTETPAIGHRKGGKRAAVLVGQPQAQPEECLPAADSTEAPLSDRAMHACRSPFL